MTQTARLTSALLVRKGQAFPTGGFACPTLNVSQPLPAPDKLRPRRGVALVRSELDGDAARPAGQAGGGERRSSHGGRVALTLRLDRDRHRQLRIFAARGERTCQEVIVRALDAYLEACGADCACLRHPPGSCHS